MKNKTDNTKTKKTIKLLLLCSFALLIASSFFSCGKRPIAYGVILWPEVDSVFKEADIVEIIAESRVRDIFNIRTEDGTIVEAVRWRIKKFPGKEEAEEYVNQYLPYKTMYAKAKIHALPVRETRDRLSSRIYRLAEDEIMKVLDRSEEISDEAGLKDYWYQILTKEGTIGYCFGYYLSVFDRSVDNGRSDEHEDQPAALKHFLQTVWRPTYFNEMIKEKKIDLHRLSTRYGLFPYPEQEKIELVLPGESHVFSYENIYQADAATFIFEGSSLQVIIVNSGEISISFTTDNEEKSIAFQALKGDIEEIIDKELERRDELYQSFVEKGDTLQSTAYGSIFLEEENKFRWENYDKLVPHVIPQRASETGFISFHVFLSQELEDVYEGVISFQFDGTAASSYLNFFYNFTDAGIRLEFLPVENIEENIAQKRSSSPLYLFFSY